MPRFSHRLRPARACGFLCVALWGFASVAAAQQASLRGFITDRSSGAPLEGANVVLQEAGRGAVTNKDGYYQISRLVPGRYTLRVSYVGYVAHLDTLDLGPGALLTLNLALEPAAETLEEVVVAAEGGATRMQAGQQTIRPADLQRIPTPDLSGDLASYLQSLPGVVALGDRGGQLFIRGGTPSQNLVLLDGLLVYQPFHIVGFFSAFPEDLVSQVEMYAGGFGARYSGRISSVIDVRMREGNLQRVEGAASVSPFLAGVRLEGPLRKGSVSVLGSLRRSVIEHLGPALTGEDLPLRFGDLFIKLHSAGRGNARYSAFALHTYDRGRIDPEEVEQADLFRWSNLVLGGRILASPAEAPVLVEFNSGLSYVQNAVGEAAEPERTSDALQVSSEVNLTHFAGRTEVSWGLFVRANWMGYRLGEQFTNVRMSEELIIGSGAYLEARMPVGTRLQLNPGLAATVYPFLYRPVLEPRFRFVWRPRGGEGPPELSGALGLYRQTIVGISDERDAGSVFLAWLPAPIGGAQARALHALVGWRQRLGPWFHVAAEGYYKRLGNIHVPIWSAIARFTTTLTLADGTVYGLDTRLEFQRPPFYAYLGYGLAHTEYTAAQQNFGLWFGEPVQRYHPPHDRRHQVNAVLNLTLGRFQTSLRWQFGSGLPYTRPLGFDDLLPLRGLIDVRRIYGIPRVLYERPYQGRLPAYHRLDFSVERSFIRPFGELTVQAGAINVYDRANLFYYDVFTVRRVDQLPLLPFVSIRLETR